MSDVLDEYRQWKARWPDRLGTHYIGCYLHHHECMIHRLAAEVERLRNGAPAACETVQPTLTEAERATLYHLRNWLRHIPNVDIYHLGHWLRHIPDVDALLARLGGER